MIGQLSEGNTSQQAQIGQYGLFKKCFISQSLSIVLEKLNQMQQKETCMRKNILQHKMNTQN